MDRREPEAPLHRALDAAKALHLHERHPCRHPPDAPARRDDDALVAAEREVPEAERALPAGAARRRRALRGRAGEDAVEELERERARADRKHGAELPALDAAL